MRSLTSVRKRLPLTGKTSPSARRRRSNFPLVSVIVSFLLILCLSSALDAAGRPATDLMSEALKLRTLGKLSPAIEKLREAVELGTGPVQKNLARFMLGDCLMEAGQPARARDIFSEILDSETDDENSAEALYRIAQCYSKLGNAESMRKSCRSMLSRYPSSPFAELARALLKTGGSEIALPENSDPNLPMHSLAPRKSGPEAAPEEPQANPEVSDSSVQARPQKLARVVPGKTLPRQPVQSEPEEKAQAEESAGSSSSAKGAAQEARATIPDLPSPAPSSAPSPSEKPQAPPVKSREKRAQARTGQVPSASVAAPKSGSTAEPSSTAVPAPEPPAPKSVARAPAPKERQPTPAPAPVAIADLLDFPSASQDDRESLATEILKDQQYLATEKNPSDKDEVLFRMAEATLQFGEFLAACKTFDLILTECPKSKLVEKAYFQAIRLRAKLGVYPSVVEWGEVFLNTFPRSSRIPDMKRLVAFARQAGEKKQAGPEPAKSRAKPATSGTKTDSAGGAGEKPARTSSRANGEISDDPVYQRAKRRMADGHFKPALADFRFLATEYPREPKLWWDLTLLHVQLEDYSEAEAAANKFLSFDPGNTEGRSLLGYIHYRQKNFDQAAKEYEQLDSTEKEGIDFFDSEKAAKVIKRNSDGKTTSTSHKGVENEH